MISFGSLGFTTSVGFLSPLPFLPSRVALVGLSLRLRCVVERELSLALLLSVKFKDDVALDDIVSLVVESTVFRLFSFEYPLGFDGDLTRGNQHVSANAYG